MPIRLALAVGAALFGLASQLVDPGFAPSSTPVASCAIEASQSGAGCGAAR